ncbi:MAG TPA: TMEM165/GDT1 family protein [Ideonella sp.]|uniref:TMEM165/GDT1 family protein n=1 Tax=Ideonella sp. TaxID=1929293 RepID=UPI002E2F1430|nr:TMEM165/GDT1 family protein [Ideonella sp.]HEX5685269.1 TMEM165/GDT1 family protein [Ideonella sp.]
MDAFAVSTGVVALGEMGDKTQLLALLLAARYRAPRAIIAGIFVATLANHAAASALGAWLTRVLDPTWLRWALGASFIAVAVWMLIPDRVDEDQADRVPGHLGVFWLTTVAFFLAEMGDKTQIATVMLAARYDALVTVTAGTTLGMMIANVPVVVLGDKVAAKVPMRLVHGVAALIFALLGSLTLLGVGPLPGAQEPPAVPTSP